MERPGFRHYIVGRHASSGSATPSIFVDRKIVIGIVNRDLGATQLKPVNQILDWVTERKVTLRLSTTVREELDKFQPSSARGPYDEVYGKFTQLEKKSDMTWVDPSGNIRQQQLYSNLRRGRSVASGQVPSWRLVP